MGEKIDRGRARLGEKMDQLVVYKSLYQHSFSIPHTRMSLDHVRQGGRWQLYEVSGCTRLRDSVSGCPRQIPLHPLSAENEFSFLNILELDIPNLCKQPALPHHQQNPPPLVMVWGANSCPVKSRSCTWPDHSQFIRESNRKLSRKDNRLGPPTRDP